MVQVSRAFAALGGEAIGEHADDGIELLAGQIAIGICAPDHLEEVIFSPFLGG